MSSGAGRVGAALIDVGEGGWALVRSYERASFSSILNSESCGFYQRAGPCLPCSAS